MYDKGIIIFINKDQRTFFPLHNKFKLTLIYDDDKTSVKLETQNKKYTKSYSSDLFTTITNKMLDMFLLKYDKYVDAYYGDEIYINLVNKNNVSSHYWRNMAQPMGIVSQPPSFKPTNDDQLAYDYYMSLMYNLTKTLFSEELKNNKIFTKDS